MRAEDIVTTDDLEVWLTGLPESVGEDRTRQIAVTIAARAAMRVWPIWLQGAHQFSLTTLPVCRSLLIAGVPFDLTRPIRMPAAQAAAASSMVAARAADNIGADLGASRSSLNAVADLAVSYRSSAAAQNAAARRTAAIARAAHFAVSASLSIPSCVSTFNATISALSPRTLAEKLTTAATLADALALQQEGNIWTEPLWHASDNPLADLWDTEKHRLSADPQWAFWIDWYDRALEGWPQDWDLLQKIALKAPNFWDGPDAEVNARIADLVAAHRNVTDPTDISGALQTVSVTKNAIKTVKAGIARHRADLPPTFDAIEGFISLEVHRLQKKNVCDELEAQEVRHQIGVLLTLHTAIDGLRKTIPASGEVTEKQAKDATRLLTLYKTKLSSLPRDKVDDVAAGVWDAGGGVAKVSLIFASTAMFGFFGLPASLGFAAGAMAFAPKQSADLIKGAKEWFKTQSGTGT